jgi:hypothetical protein
MPPPQKTLYDVLAQTIGPLFRLLFETSEKRLMILFLGGALIILCWKEPTVVPNILHALFPKGFNAPAPSATAPPGSQQAHPTPGTATAPHPPLSVTTDAVRITVPQAAGNGAGPITVIGGNQVNQTVHNGNTYHNATGGQIPPSSGLQGLPQAVQEEAAAPRQGSTTP